MPAAQLDLPSLAALGVVDLPARIVEPLIAATIIWVAVENLLAPTQLRWRALVAAAFGLVHGLGFASALTELGLPREAMVLARPGRLERLPQILSVLVAVIGAVWLVERVLL